MRCSPYHTNSALYPVIEHYKRLARWQPEDSVEARLAKLEAALETYNQPVGETVPLLASLLSLPLPEDRYPPLALAPQEQKQWTQDAIIAMTLEKRFARFRSLRSRPARRRAGIGRSLRQHRARAGAQATDRRP